MSTTLGDAKKLADYDRQKREVARLRKAMREAHAALDQHLGDTDLDHFKTLAEMREDAPDQWAAMHLAKALNKPTRR